MILVCCLFSAATAATPTTSAPTAATPTTALPTLATPTSAGAKQAGWGFTVALADQIGEAGGALGGRCAKREREHDE